MATSSNQVKISSLQDRFEVIPTEIQDDTSNWTVKNKICCGVITAANIIQPDDLSQKIITSNDRSGQASDEIRVHPYGSSFEAINKKSEEPEAAQTDPMSAAASYYHHSGGAKGWLDMGAWTKNKGAFGWYADFPVGGKGK